MISNDGNDLVPAQEKLEWVTPKISLMDAGDTDGKRRSLVELTGNAPNNPVRPDIIGPS